MLVLIINIIIAVFLFNFVGKTKMNLAINYKLLKNVAVNFPSTTFNNTGILLSVHQIKEYAVFQRATTVKKTLQIYNMPSK